MIKKFLIVSILAMASFTPVFAQVQAGTNQVMVPTLAVTVTTDRQSYVDGDKIMISGSVREIAPNLPVSIEVRDPSGSVVMVDQVSPHPNKTFSVEITAGGFLWKSSGTYSLIAQYGSTNRSDIIHFQFGGTVFTSNKVVEGTDLSISYKIINGNLTKIIADSHTKSLLLSIDSTANGSITVTLPRALIDAKVGGSDSAFVVTDHGTPVIFKESKFDTVRTLTIPFSGPADERLMITGTQVIPEFGQSVSVILVIAVVAAFFVVKQSKLGLTFYDGN